MAPLCSINGSSNCCIRRSPPSPDALPPRPAAPPGLAPHRVSKDHIPTWTTVNETELHTIFDDVADTDEDIRKHTAETKAKAQTLLEADLSDMDSDDTEIRIKKSSSTLKLITEKLRQHISSGALSKRHSRSSVGTSEEEIERRAELRRIRQRRIQEELSNEDIYDDDAKSLPSINLMIPFRHAPPRLELPLDTKGFLPPPRLKTPALLYPALSFPHLSPFDPPNDPIAEVGRALMVIDPRSPIARRMSDPPESVISTFSNTPTLSRRHSSPIVSEWEMMPTEPQIYVHSRKSSLVSPMPPAPVILPQRVPSISEQYKSSWRLSFSADNRGQHLRKLSQGYPATGGLIPLFSGAVSPLSNKSYRGPGLRPSQNFTRLSDDNKSLDTIGRGSQNTVQSQDFGGVDGGGDGENGLTEIHLHEMGISNILSCKGLQSSSTSPQPSSWGSHQRGISSIGGLSEINRERARYMQSSSNSAALSERIPPTWGNIVGESSSVYPSGSDSLEPSRSTSRFNLRSFFPGSRSNSEITQPRDQEVSQGVLARLPTDNNSSSSVSISLTRYPRRPTIDDSSLLASETSSFHEREAELRVVQARFASSEARRVNSTPVSSKFREEFGSEVEETPTNKPPPQSRKASAFARIVRIATRSYDGTTNMEDLLSVPVPDFDPKGLKTPGSAHPASPFSPSPLTASPLGLGLFEDDDAANAWGKALKHESDERTNDVAGHLQIPKKGSSVGRENSDVSEELNRPKGAFETLFGLGKKKSSAKEQKSAAEEYKEKFEERVAVKELVMDSWEEEMTATAARAKARSRNIVKKSKPPGPDRRYPATWSRYLSHDRKLRAVSAGAVDRVDIKDFAILGRDKQGEDIWCLEHDEEGHHSSIDDPAAGRGFRKKVKEKVAHKAYKFDTSERQSAQTSGRRGSLSIANELEYPELEILPFTLMTGADRDKEVHSEEMSAEERRRKKLIAGMMDGSLDDARRFSIADPRFYDDCVSHPLSRSTSLMATPTRRSKKDKYSTWSGRDWNGYHYGNRRNPSLASMVLRKSTDDHFHELERMERHERESVLRLTEEVFGRGSL